MSSHYQHEHRASPVRIAVEVNLARSGYEAYTRDQATLDAGTWRPIADVLGVEHVTSTAFADRLIGNSAANLLSGGSGNDTLTGAEGNDTFTGGAGLDRFDFATALNSSTNVDRITDYSLVDDLIRLDNDVFTAFATENVAMAAGAFHSGAGVTTSHDADDRIVYNTTTGNLYYDPDGTGAAGATLFATLTAAPAVNAGDFFVVA